MPREISALLASWNCRGLSGQHIWFFEANPTWEFSGAAIEDREYSIELPFSEQFD
jgi:hypothetical protein